MQQILMLETGCEFTPAGRGFVYEFLQAMGYCIFMLKDLRA